VIIDGTAIGATPISYELAAGRHHLTVSAPGHDVDTREIVVAPGDTTRIDVPLTAKEDTVAPANHSPPIAAISLVAAGGAAIIGGAICIAVDEDAGPDSPRRIHDTAPLGVALLATGAVSAAAGTYLWIRHRSSTSAPVAAISRDAAYVGWAARF
jgi:hypothetical protein